ncbi:uncharacterized protein EV154DRAFT_486166 [Mucor mucedo]|uniref:uncharacterized protein n=1 Tax=Mucor mucedo TaxID=29922 RepID=UPI00221F8E1F|nr:uncharacterized protein EV154DRAFT_486166 [Mucor mucedo]KAI7878532.1 hypothetical protein EV154DRAFT_486166 [Mucor mucedo]
MNYTEDKTANNTNFAIVGMMPASSWKEDEEEHFFNGKRDLFWPVAAEESEIQEGIDKVKGLIESEDPAIVLLVGMVLGLYWFGRGVECGPLVVEGINPSAANPQADYFETPNNQFYRLINESGVTGEIQVNRASELRLINAGVMNFVDRATQTEKEINNDELAAGKYRLQIAIQNFHPRPRNFEGVPVFCVPHGSNKGLNLTFNDKLIFYQQLSDYLIDN